MAKEEDIANMCKKLSPPLGKEGMSNLTVTLDATGEMHAHGMI
jgi:hypothetical protein